MGGNELITNEIHWMLISEHTRGGTESLSRRST